MQRSEPLLQFQVAVGQRNELGARQGRWCTNPGDMRHRQIHRVAGQAPRRERHIERRDLDAAAVNFEPVQIVSEDGAGRLLGRQAFVGLPERRENAERLNQEMAAAAARVEIGDLRRALGPSRERAGRRPP